jgi:hypothetical protein
MAILTLGKYTIKPDAHGWVAGVVIVRERKNDAGEDVVVEEFTSPSYFARLPQALNWLLDQRLRDSDATSIRGLRSEVLAFRSELEPFFLVESPDD